MRAITAQHGTRSVISQTPELTRKEPPLQYEQEGKAPLHHHQLSFQQQLHAQENKANFSFSPEMHREMTGKSSHGVNFPI